MKCPTSSLLPKWLAGAAVCAGLLGTATFALAQSGAGVSEEAVEAQPESAQAPPGPPPMPPPLVASARPQASGGEALYVTHCGMCHGPNGMGTGLLGRSRDVALLEARPNLPAQFVTVAVRQGIGNMPAIPRGEVSDEELQAIADYLAAGPHGEPAT